MRASGAVRGEEGRGEESRDGKIHELFRSAGTTRGARWQRRERNELTWLCAIARRPAREAWAVP